MGFGRRCLTDCHSASPTAWGCAAIRQASSGQARQCLAGYILREAMIDHSGTFLHEATRILIQFVALQGREIDAEISPRSLIRPWAATCQVAETASYRAGRSRAHWQGQCRAINDSLSGRSRARQPETSHGGPLFAPSASPEPATNSTGEPGLSPPQSRVTRWVHCTCLGGKTALYGRVRQRNQQRTKPSA